MPPLIGLVASPAASIPAASALREPAGARLERARRAPPRSRRPRRTRGRARRCSGMSSRSGSLRRGAITRAIPARWAASAFSFSPPIGSTWPVSVISPVIAVSSRTGRPRDERRQRRRHRDAGARPVLRHRARRDVQVEVVRRRTSPRELGRARACAAHPRERGLGGLLHHVAELAGDRQLALARHRASPRRTARRRPTGVHARPVATPGCARAPARLGQEARAAEQLAHARRGHGHLALRAGPRPRGARPCGRPRRSRARGCARRPRACARR